MGASQALDVAREHGLPESVLRRAEHYLLMDGQDMGAVMDRLNELAGQREAELERLRQEEIRTRDKRRQLQERYEKDLARLHEELRGRSRELMAAWKSGKATAKQTMKEMARLRAELAEKTRRRADGAGRRSPSYGLAGGRSSPSQALEQAGRAYRSGRTRRPGQTGYGRRGSVGRVLRSRTVGRRGQSPDRARRGGNDPSFPARLFFAS